MAIIALPEVYAKGAKGNRVVEVDRRAVDAQTTIASQELKTPILSLEEFVTSYHSDFCLSNPSQVL